MKKTRYKSRHFRPSGISIQKLVCLALVLVMIVTTLPVSISAAFAQESASAIGEQASTADEALPEAPVEYGAQLESDMPAQPADTEGEQKQPTAEAQEEASEVQDASDLESDAKPGQSESVEPTVYANSISGALWLDVFEDKDSGAHNGDGIRQPEEEPFADYEVSLYLADDKDSPVDTVTTDSEGAYIFENLEPGTYVVGLSACTKDDTEYLLPIVGINDDTQFFSDYNEDYTTVYSKPIVIDADTVVSDIDVGMRTPMGVQPAADFGDLTVNPTQSTAAASGTVPATWATDTNWGVAIKSDLSGLDISYKKSTDSTWTSVGGVPVSTSFSFNLSGLSQSTAYTIRVQPTYTHRGGIYIDSSRTCTWARTYSFTTKAPPQAPLKGPVIVSNVGKDGVDISATFDANNGTSAYILDHHLAYRIKGASAWTDIGNPMGGTVNGKISGTGSGTLTGLQPGTTYEVYWGLSNGIYRNDDPSITEFTTIGKPLKGPVIVSNVGKDRVDISATFNANRGSSTNSAVYICDHHLAYRIKGASAWTGIGNPMGGTVNGKISGTGSGTLTGLQPGTTYEVYWGLSNQVIRNDDPTITEFTTVGKPIKGNVTFSNITQSAVDISATFDANRGSATYPYICDHHVSYRVKGTSAWTKKNEAMGGTVTGVGKISGTGSGTLTGLQPNTTYQVYWGLSNGSIRNDDVTITEFTTLPDFVSWQPTPDSMDATKATVSGTYAGSAEITGATITYGMQPNLSDGTTITLNKGTDFTDTGFSYDLTGLTPGQTYYVQTTVTNATGTTTSTAKPFHMPGMQFTVSNTLTGSYADKSKDFIFTLTMTDNADVPLSGASITHAGGTLTLDGNGQATFTLKHGESIEFTDILGTNKICIEETPVTGYTASYDLDSGGVQTGDNTGFISVNSLDHTAAFTNERGNIVPTGVNTGNMQGMYVILAGGLLIAVLAGFSILLYRSERKRRYE